MENADLDFESIVHMSTLADKEYECISRDIPEITDLQISLFLNEKNFKNALNDLDYEINDALTKSIKAGAVTLIFSLDESDHIYFYINIDILESDTIINLFYEALSADVPKSFGITSDIAKRETFHFMKVIMIAKGEV